MPEPAQLDFEAPTLRFFAPGIPKGQPRVKAFARKMGAKHVARVYTPDTAEGWKQAVVAAALPHRLGEMIAGAVCVDLVFFMPRPKAHFKGKAQTLRPTAPTFHTSTPDKDNLEKAVYDALTQAGLFWRDDAQIADGRTTKAYGDETGCLVTIKAL